MKKKEFAVGEVFQFGLVKLKCVKRKHASDRCIGCFLMYCGRCSDDMDAVGSCSQHSREDEQDVIFIKVEE